MLLDSRNPKREPELILHRFCKDHQICWLQQQRNHTWVCPRALRGAIGERWAPRLWPRDRRLWWYHEVRLLQGFKASQDRVGREGWGWGRERRQILQGPCDKAHQGPPTDAIQQDLVPIFSKVEGYLKHEHACWTIWGLRTRQEGKWRQSSKSHRGDKRVENCASDVHRWGDCWRWRGCRIDGRGWRAEEEAWEVGYSEYFRWSRMI